MKRRAWSIQRRGTRRLYSANDLQWVRCLRSLIHDEGISIPGIKGTLRYATCYQIADCPQEICSRCEAVVDQIIPQGVCAWRAMPPARRAAEKRMWSGARQSGGARSSHSRKKKSPLAETAFWSAATGNRPLSGAAHRHLKTSRLAGRFSFQPFFFQNVLPPPPCHNWPACAAEGILGDAQFPAGFHLAAAIALERLQDHLFFNLLKGHFRPPDKSRQWQCLALPPDIPADAARQSDRPGRE